MGGSGIRLEPLTRLANFAAAGVCAVTGYWVLLLCGAVIVALSGSLAGALLVFVAYLFFFVFFVAAAVPFVIWFHRAYARLPRHGIRTRFPAGMAIGCWFIPFANLVLPGMIGAEIWSAGQRRYGGGSNLAYIWWGTYVGGALFGMFSTVSVLFALPGLALLLVATAFAVAFVRRASERLDELDGLAPPTGSLDEAIRSVYTALPIPVTLIGDQPGEPAVAARQGPAGSAPHGVSACGSCGAAGVAGASFCGACGARVAG